MSTTIEIKTTDKKVLVIVTDLLEFGSVYSGNNSFLKTTQILQENTTTVFCVWKGHDLLLHEIQDDENIVEPPVPEPGPQIAPY